MTPEEIKELQDTVDGSPALKNLERRLSAQLHATEEQTGYGIDPLTILFIISIILQVISLCLHARTEADVSLDMTNAHSLPPRKLMRLKRRLNKLWAEHCQKNGKEPGNVNPFFAAAVGSVKECAAEDVIGIIQASK